MKKILPILTLTILTALSIHLPVNSQEAFKNIDFNRLKKGINQLKLEDYVKYNYEQYLVYIGVNIYKISEELEKELDYDSLTYSEKSKILEPFAQLEEQWGKKLDSLYEQEVYSTIYTIKNEVSDSISNDLKYLAQEEVSNHGNITQWKPPTKEEIVNFYVEETTSEFLDYCEQLASDDTSKQQIKEDLAKNYLSAKREYEQYKLKYGETFISNYDSKGSEIYISSKNIIKSFNITSPEIIRLLEKGCPNYFEQIYYIQKINE